MNSEDKRQDLNLMDSSDVPNNDDTICKNNLSSKNKSRTPDISTEDEELKTNIDFLVEEICKSDGGTSKNSLDMLVDHLRTASSSLSTVPKALKYARYHFVKLAKYYQTLNDSNFKKLLASTLSLLASTIADPTFKEEEVPLIEREIIEQKETKLTTEDQEKKVALANAEESKKLAEALAVFEDIVFPLVTLKYCLRGDTDSMLLWGQEYVKSLVSDIIQEFENRYTTFEISSDKLYVNEICRSAVVELNEKAKNQDNEKNIQDGYVKIYTDDLELLIQKIVPDFIKHNAEWEAVDLLCDCELIHTIPQYVHENTVAERICAYLIQLYQYSPNVANAKRILFTCFELYYTYKMFSDAMRIALKLDNIYLVSIILRSVDSVERIQLSFLMQRHNFVFNFESLTTELSLPCNVENTINSISNDDFVIYTSKKLQKDYLQCAASALCSEEECETLTDIICGSGYSAQYFQLAKDLQVLEAKHPEDIYKSHLEESQYKGAGAKTTARAASAGPDGASARQNLAAAFVNSFVNLGFCSDKLLLNNTRVDDSGNHIHEMPLTHGTWIFQNKDHSLFSTTASLGNIMLWNAPDGISLIDSYQNSKDENMRGGACLALGLICCNMKGECDPAYSLLSEHIESESASVKEKLGSILGLGFAYAGSNRQDLIELIVPQVADTSLCFEISAAAAVSIGLIFVGSCDADITECLLSSIIERHTLNESTDNNPGEPSAPFNPLSSLFALGLGLIFFGKEEACRDACNCLEEMDHRMGSYTSAVVEGMAYAGTNDVLKVQKCLQAIVFDSSNKIENTDTGNLYETDNQSVKPKNYKSKWTGMTTTDESNCMYRNLEYMTYVLNLALISVGERIGSSMTIRLLDHVLQYGTILGRRAVPIALALQNISNPNPSIVETLLKLTREPDADLALNSIIALGFIGCSTNNSKIAQSLRQLAGYYYKDPQALFIVRISQGLLHLGKGLLTACSIHSDQFLINKVALGSLTVLFHSCLNLRQTILSKYHYLLYFLTPAVSPRMLFTVNPQMEPIPVPVRVGTAVGTTSQAGTKLRKISGFQTHTTPVLLAYGERAELAADDEYTTSCKVLEGVVVVKKVK